MNGLRVYIIGATNEQCGGHGVFYSRRDGGPYYQWCYQEDVSHWRVARVLRTDFSAKLLSPASWKGIPTALQTSIIEHYLD